MQNNAFTPFGPTYLIGTAAPVQVITNNGLSPTSYRIRNTSASANYIAWYPPLASGNAPIFGAVQPTAGVPSQNTIGMLGASIEVFELPGNCWFIGNASGFEVTPGEGF